MNVGKEKKVYVERMTVSLDDFLKYLIKKWKTMIIFIMVFALLFAASVKTLGEKIIIPPSEEYLKLKEQESSIGGYIENAPMMEIDAMCVPEIVIYLSNISDREALKSHFDSGYIWSGFEYEHYLYYIMELVTWKDANVEESTEIIVRHPKETQCVLMAEFLSEKICEFDKEAEILIGKVHINGDAEIAEAQRWFKERFNAIEGQLEYARAGCTIEASLPVAIMLGALVGGVVGTVALFCGFLLYNKNSK